MLTRAEQVGWYWEECDMRMVMDNYGFPVIVPFCAEYDFAQFEVI